MSKAVPSHLFRACAAALGLLAVDAAAGKLDGFIKSFEDNKDYIQPFATFFGSMTNSGWYQGAGVGKGFGFYFGIPMNITYIADADRTYTGHFTDVGCQTAHSKNPSAVCDEHTSYSAPTAFGRKRAPTMHMSVPDKDGNIVDSLDVPVSDGLGALADQNWMPFLMPQLGVSFFNTEFKLRYMGIPEIAGVSFSMPAVGIQHDISSFVPIPVPGLHVSAAVNVTWLTASFVPGGDIDGKLDLSGTSYFAGVLVGYSALGFAEVFLETGWEGASMESSGSLVINPSDPANAETVKPSLSVDGRNGFRAAVNVAVHFGYQAVVGQNFGANLGHSINIIGYRY